MGKTTQERHRNDTINKNAIMQQCNNEEEFVSKDTLCADAQAVKNKSSVPIPEPETEEKRKKRLAAEKKKKAELFFEECWNLYPVKKGKGKLSDACKTKVFKIGEEFKRCIERYIKDVKKRRTEFPELKYQNGSSFFNSGYVDYLDENFNKPDLLSPQKNKVTFEWSEDNVEYVLENGKRIAYMFEGRRVPLVNNNK